MEAAAAWLPARNDQGGPRSMAADRAFVLWWGKYFEAHNRAVAAASEKALPAKVPPPHLQQQTSSASSSSASSSCAAEPKAPAAAAFSKLPATHAAAAAAVPLAADPAATAVPVAAAPAAADSALAPPAITARVNPLPVKAPPTERYRVQGVLLCTECAARMPPDMLTIARRVLVWDQSTQTEEYPWKPEEWV